MDEGIAFTVDEHPLLEQWPDHSRKYLCSEELSELPASDEHRQSPPFETFKEEHIPELPGAYKLDMNDTSPQARKKSDHNGLLEPQVVLIKNE